ncbi:MAG: hypothetical protein J6R92_01805 [Akkermansia sp.]|nr:hypothetical protein [Akkermansia sp.]
MKIILSMMRGVLGRTWVVPVLTVLGTWLCMFTVCCLGGASGGVGVVMRMLLGWANVVVWLVQGLLLLGLGVWLVVFTVRRLIQRQWRAMLAWVWSGGAAALVCPSIGMGIFVSAFACYDDFTLGISVPEELSPGGRHGMAVPRAMHFQAPLHEGKDAELPAVVQQYADLCKVDTSMCVGGDEVLPTTASNLEKLAKETPELLHEYCLRAYCYEVLTPGVHACRHLSALYHPEKSVTGGPRLNGDEWMVSFAHDWSYVGYKRDSGEPSVFALKGMQLLDEALAPLAAKADRETLDSLVPALPDKPFIVLEQRGQPGMYRLQLMAPADYPAGTFCVKTREYTKNKELSIRNTQIQNLSTKLYRQICQLSEPVDFTVYSGEWGEYYASVWELHFIPADGSVSRCVNSQLYLMQGWSR